MIFRSAPLNFHLILNARSLGLHITVRHIHIYTHYTSLLHLSQIPLPIISTLITMAGSKKNKEIKTWLMHGNKSNNSLSFLLCCFLTPLSPDSLNNGTCSPTTQSILCGSKPPLQRCSATCAIEQPRRPKRDDRPPHGSSQS